MTPRLAPFVAAGTTVLLMGLFLSPLGAERPRPIAQASLAGKESAFTREPALAAKPEAPAKAPLPAETAKTPAAPKQAAPHRRRAKPALAPAPAPRQERGAPSAVAITTTAAETPVVSAAASETAPRENWQDLLDRFENDPSRYPLDRAVRKDDLTLTLEGLARLDRYYVLKVTLSNQATADFFVKDFTVRAGSLLLSSRSSFRILVEPQRERSGYVVFEKPKPGSAVHLALKEDGGKGRVLETSVPYPF